MKLNMDTVLTAIALTIALSLMASSREFLNLGSSPDSNSSLTGATRLVNLISREIGVPWGGVQ